MKFFHSLTAVAAIFSAMSISARAADLDFYVGTYTKKDASRGIYHFKLNAETGVASGGELAGETASPSFLAIHPNGRFLYSVGEGAPMAGKKGGPVSAFAIGADGKLALLDQQASGGDGACHISIGEAGKNAFVANYGGGSIEALPIEADGKLGEPSDFIQHTGTGPDKARQEKPHAHSIYEHGGRVYSCDLGTDHVDIYKLDLATGKLTPNEPPFAIVAPGTGPRHLAFHGDHCYVIGELKNTITVLKVDSANGALVPQQTISTLPNDYSGKNSTAEIFVHPNGKFLYGSNRTHDTIAVFSIAADGSIGLLEHVSTRGKSPRNFAIDPTGGWLLAANQDTNNIVIFKIEAATGHLTPTGQELKVGAPVCIAFVPVK